MLRVRGGGAPRERRDRGVARLGIGERDFDMGEGLWGEDFGVAGTLGGENSM